MLHNHRNQIKRNRNIGTKKSGYKKQSKFDIPWQNHNPFYENIKIQTQCQKTINGKTYDFIVEKLNTDYIYSCDIDEICGVLSHSSKDDLEGLKLIILRQPKKKEEILNLCWGMLVYDFEYNGERQPAIILEAINLNTIIKIKKTGISPFVQKELEQLQIEGHQIVTENKKIIIKPTLQSAKNTQLYRTLLHEVGHYVYFKKGYNINNYEENEAFANNYAKTQGSLHGNGSIAPILA